MAERGVLTVVSGFSGAGKGTIVKRIVSEDPNLALSISMTTRSPREGEQDGKDYFFVTKERFEEAISNGELLEFESGAFGMVMDLEENGVGAVLLEKSKDT